MKPSEQLRELLTWYRKTNCNDVQRSTTLFEGVESLIPAVEQLEQAQRERDAEIRTWLSNIINHTQMDIDASREISKVIKKLEGGA